MRVGADGGSFLPRRQGVFERQALGILDLSVIVQRGALKTRTLQSRLALNRLLAAEHTVHGKTLVVRQDVIGDHAHTNQKRGALAALIDRDQKWEWMHQVRRDVEKNLSLVQRLPDQADFVILQIPQSTMYQAGRPAGGT